MKWYIGCSGFYYNHWKNIFYPEGLPKTKWFEFYAAHFNTLELNVTFYRFPELAVFKTWHQKSPDDFLFTVKAPRRITHYRQFHDTKPLMAEYYSVMKKGLKNKLGMVLFQLPPRMRYKQELLERIIETMDNKFQNVLECRHPSWWQEEIYEQLTKHKIIFSGISHPQLPDQVIQATPAIYYRLHGVPDLYASPYDDVWLHQLAGTIAGNKKTKSAFIYFNNDIGGSAIKNALEMQSFIKKKKL